MAEKTTGTIILPDGDQQAIPTIVLDHDTAKLLRDYKKHFLLKFGLREALYCRECFQTQHDGTDAYVTDNQIAIKCRHRLLFYQGQSF
jgi:hypothetical protein